MSYYKPTIGGGGGIISGLFQLSGTSVAASGAIPEPLFVQTLNVGTVNVSGNEIVSGTFVGQSGKFTQLIVGSTNVLTSFQNSGVFQASGIYPASGIYQLSGAAGGGGNSGSTFVGQVASFSGNGSGTIFLINHNIGTTPSRFTAIPNSVDAMGDYRVEASGNTLSVIYTTARPSGTANISLGWMADTNATISGGQLGSNILVGGSALFSGNTSGTTFLINHNIGVAPSRYGVIPSTVDAVGDYRVEASGNTLSVIYTAARASGDSNIGLVWFADTNNVSGGPADPLNVGALNVSGTSVFSGSVNIQGNISGALTYLPYAYIVYKDNNTFKAKNGKTGIVDFQNADACILLDSVISGATNKGPILLKEVSGGYPFTSGLNLINRSFWIDGEGYKFTLGGGLSRVGTTTLVKTFSGGTIFDMTNTGSCDQKITNLGIAGDDTGTAIDWFITAGNYGEKLKDVAIEDFDVGIRFRRIVYSQFNNVLINSCPTYGIWLDSSGIGSTLANTALFDGCTIINNGLNFYITRCNNVQITNSSLEAGVSGGMIVTSGSKDLIVDGCSFEANAFSGFIAIDEMGSNNRYLNNIFDSTIEMTAIRFGATADNSIFGGNIMQANASGATIHVVALSGASNISFRGNTKGTNTPTNLDWQVSGLLGGVKFTAYGNDGLRDQTSTSGIIIQGQSGNFMIKELDTNGLAIRNSDDTSGMRLTVQSINTGSIRDAAGTLMTSVIDPTVNWQNKTLNNIAILITNSGNSRFNQSGGQTEFRGPAVFSGVVNAQSGQFTALNVTSGLVANNIKYGSFLDSGNASKTIYTVSHGIVNPTSWFITPASPQARGNPDSSGASGQLIVTYPIAPASGDVRLTWGVFA